MLSSKTKRELKVDQRQILIDSIEIGIPSPQQILTWGERLLPNGKKVGQIKNSKTVNYKRFTPFRDGLFCERIFGPVTSFVCACGKKQPHSKASFCEKCEVEYIDQRSRRYRLGYISLLSPVTHVWYLKGRPSYLSLFLGKRKKTIVRLAYCDAYLIEHGISKKSHTIKSSDIPPEKKSIDIKQVSQPSYKKQSFFDLKPEKREVYENKSFASSSVAKRVSPFLFTDKKTNSSIAGKYRSFRSLQKKALYEPRRMFEGLHFPSLSEKSVVAQKASLYQRYQLRKRNNFLKSRNEVKPQLERYKSQSYQVSGSTFSLKNGRFFYSNHLKKQNPAFLQLQIFVKRFVGNKITYKCKSKICKKICMQSFVSTGNKSYTLLDPPMQNRTLQRRLKKERQEQLEIRNKFEKNTYFSCQAFSYGRYFYSRQHTLPFLPSFVSHFYLRDALLSFVYSIASYKDFPLIEYCHTKRWEPLRDVHKFMAHKTVDNLKKNSPYGIFELQQKSTTSPYFEKLRGYKSHVKDSQSDSWKKEKRQFEKGNVQILMTCKSKCASFELRSNKATYKSSCKAPHTSTLGVTKLGFLNSSATVLGSCLTANPFTRTKLVASTSAALLARRAAVRVTAGQKKSFVFSEANLLAMEQTKTSTNLVRSFVSPLQISDLYALVTPKAKSFISLKSSFNEALQSKKICKQIPVRTLVQRENNLPDTGEKTALSEESTKASLSGLEMTAIREILSYTGGGALQQLLQQANQHHLCKFLFAESQILRVLYETQIGIGLQTREKRAFDESSFYNPFLQAQKSTDMHSSTSVFDLRMCTAKNGSHLKKKQENLTYKEKLRTNTSRACNAAISTPFAKLSDRSLNVESFKGVGDSTFKNVGAENKWYNELQNKTSDLQKKQIRRISRRIYKIARRLKVTQLLSRNHRKPEWMILSHLPVLPPDLRPILQMSEKVIVASDLNIMYQRVIYRNNRHLRVRFIDFHLVTAIQRLVQDAVDRLIENGKGGSKPYSTQGDGGKPQRPLKSLSEILKGKKGRFRLNLLGKRVDFSGRSVIVVSPLCKIHECGLPKDIALELYHYFLLRQLIVKKHCASIVTAKKMIRSKSSLMWDILRDLMYHHPVLLNRAPTLHRLGIQAFQPKLSVGNAILLHPLVCSGFNADFDGDQMGVHLPLSFAARAESWDLLWSRNNLLSPATGQPMLVPSQDMVLGFYYITAKGAPCKSSHSGTSTAKLSFPKSSGNLPNKYKASLSFSKSGCKKSCKSVLQNKKSPSVFEKTARFLNRNEIVATLQTGKIKLHQPIWLSWNGITENEGFSQKPIELRVHGFGVQQSVYETCISSNLFTKTRGFVDTSSWSCETLTNQLHLRLARALHSIPLKALIKTRGQAEIRKIRGPAGDEHSSTDKIDTSSFFISSGPKAYCLRTTAGRTVMNNLIS